MLHCAKLTCLISAESMLRNSSICNHTFPCWDHIFFNANMKWNVSKRIRILFNIYGSLHFKLNWRGYCHAFWSGWDRESSDRDYKNVIKWQDALFSQPEQSKLIWFNTRVIENANVQHALVILPATQNRWKWFPAHLPRVHQTVYKPERSKREKGSLERLFNTAAHALLSQFCLLSGTKWNHSTILAARAGHRVALCPMTRTQKLTTYCMTYMIQFHCRISILLRASDLKKL